MNTIIYNQLNNVKATKIEFNLDSTEIYIPKTVKVAKQTLQVGKIYDIKLKPTIFNQGADSTWADNWNQGKMPQYSEYMVEIESNIGNMIKVNGVAIEDISSHFIGYLPHDSFEVTKVY